MEYGILTPASYNWWILGPTIAVTLLAIVALGQCGLLGSGFGDQSNDPTGAGALAIVAVFMILASWISIDMKNDPVRDEKHASVGVYRISSVDLVFIPSRDANQPPKLVYVLVYLKERASDGSPQIIRIYPKTVLNMEVWTSSNPRVVDNDLKAPAINPPEFAVKDEGGWWQFLDTLPTKLSKE